MLEFLRDFDRVSDAFGVSVGAYTAAEIHAGCFSTNQDLCLLALGIGSHIDQEGEAFAVGERRSEGRALDSGKPAQCKQRGGHHGAAVARRVGRRGAALRYQVDGQLERRPGFLAQSPGRLAQRFRSSSLTATHGE